MPCIDTLVGDIQDLLRNKVSEIGVGELADFGTSVAKHLEDSLVEKERRKRDLLTLYPSEIGKKCTRQVWYKYHYPDLARGIGPSTELKFFMGDFGEELMLFLAKKAGHHVELEQHQVDYHLGGARIRGRIDAVIDGVIVDVKTTSTYSFGEYRNGLTPSNDTFGYRFQLASYSYAPELSVYTAPPRLLLLDKQNANIALAHGGIPNLHNFELHVTHLAEALKSHSLPERSFKVETRKTMPGGHLNIACQYCDYNRVCWDDHSITKVLRKGGKVGWAVSLVPGGPLELLKTDLILEHDDDN